MGRFLVIATARTGSNLLVRGLNRPPATRCFGEVAKALFSAEPRAFAVISRLSGRPEASLAALHSRNVEDFIFDVLYNIRSAAVGFKLFYEHCREPGRRGLWGRLAEESAIDVIHLTRNCAFDAYLSLLYAQRTGSWLKQPGDSALPNDLSDVEIDVDDCRTFLAWYSKCRREVTRSFSSHRYLEIDYSGLVADFDGALSEVRQFVGDCEPPSGKVPLEKQASRPAWAKVKNYDALMAAFHGTEFATMFAAV